MLDWLHGVQLAEGARRALLRLAPARSAGDWPAGPLTMRQVWQFYPYENSLVTVRATGKPGARGARARGGVPRRSGERGRSCDTLEGADYEIDRRGRRGQRVVSLTGAAARTSATSDVFTVALNSYRASGGGGFGMWKRAERLGEKGNVRRLLVADARAKKRLTLEPTGNWALRNAGAGSR